MSYILVIKVVKFLYIKVGSLGFLSFRPGLYVYVGSAKKNFLARIKRHLRKKKKKFWHIDYLLTNRNTSLREIYATSKTAECKLAEGLNVFPSVKDFGSSDCKCVSHLFFIGRKNEDLKDFIRKNNLKREVNLI